MSAKNVPAPLTLARKGKGDRPALQRLSDMEKTIPVVVQQVNLSLQEIDQRVQGVLRILEAVVEKVGPTEVYAALEARRLEEQKKQEEEDAAALKTLLDAGKIVAATTVSDDSLVVFKRSQKGKDNASVRVRTSAAKLVPEIKAKLIGSEVGTVVDLNESESLTVMEIYLEAPKPEAPKPVDLAPATTTPES